VTALTVWAHLTLAAADRPRHGRCLREDCRPGTGRLLGSRAEAGEAGGCDEVVVRCSGPRTRPGPSAGVFTEDQHPVGDLGPSAETNRSAEAFARGLRGGDARASRRCRDKIALQRSQTTPQEHPRLHLDLHVADLAGQAAKEARLVSLGAERVDWDSYPDDRTLSYWPILTATVSASSTSATSTAE
jgi:Glyoxalase-like domain